MDPNCELMPKPSPESERQGMLGALWRDCLGREFPTVPRYSYAEVTCAKFYTYIYTFIYIYVYIYKVPSPNGSRSTPCPNPICDR